MNLEELERLAREAHVMVGVPKSDLLRLVSIAKAAVREPTTEEIELALERHCLKSTSISRADMRWVLAGFVADRAALIPRGANLVKGESE